MVFWNVPSSRYEKVSGDTSPTCSAWYTGSGVTVAVVDSGLNYADALQIRTTTGYSVLTHIADVTDDTGHGTKVASIIGARYAHTGVAPDATIIPVKVMDSKKHSVQDLAQGIRWAVDVGADIINISLNYKEYNQALTDAIHYALNQDVLVVTAAGNDGESKVFYPANIEGVISVSAVSNQGELAPFSNKSVDVTLGAVGINLPVLKYDPLRKKVVSKKEDGTSFAAAVVSGYLAILKEINPTDSSQELIQKLKEYVQISPNWDIQGGSGWLSLDQIRVCKSTK